MFCIVLCIEYHTVCLELIRLIVDLVLGNFQDGCIFLGCLIVWAFCSFQFSLHTGVCV